MFVNIIFLSYNWFEWGYFARMIKNLKKLRLEKGATQKTLAAVLGVSQQSVNKYENHNVEPDLNIIMKMADYFGTSVDLLIGHTDEDNNDMALHTINDDEVTMLRGYRSLSEDHKQIIRTVIESYN